MFFSGAAVTDIGIVKKVNQDSLMLKIANTSVGMACMAVVCDGLGGLEQGEVASGNVVIAFERWFEEIFLKTKKQWNLDSIRDEWERLIYSMNQKIMDYGERQGVELGTTVTAFLAVGKSYYVIHVGDCRLYEIKDYTCRLLTKDQTVVAKEVERGLLTPEQALKDNRRNVLLQCIGVTQDISPEFMCGELKEQASYLICSDGFRHEVSQEEIYEKCQYNGKLSFQELEMNLKSLVELNKMRKERDNISAILIQVGNEEC